MNGKRHEMQRGLNRKRHVKLQDEKTGNGGFSLVEMIIGIALLGIISVSVLPLFLHSYTQLIRSGEKTESLYQIQNTIESDTAVANGTAVLDYAIGGEHFSIPVNTYQVEEAYGESGNSSVVVFGK